MEKTINIDGINVNFSQNGNGSPIIMMHGWGSEHNALSVFEKVGVENHEVFNIDLPGFGKSDEPCDPWGIDEYAAFLGRFVAQLGLTNPILLGHSFGGRVAIAYAAQNPVERLILVDAAGIKPRRPLKYYLKVYSYKLARKLYPMVFGQKKAEEKIEKMRSKSGSADYRNSSPMMRKIMVKAVNTDLRHLMPSISAPTLLLWGEEDTATPMRDAHIMNRLIKNSTLVSFPGAGHFSFLDNPFQSAAVMRRFIQPTETNA